MKENILFGSEYDTEKYEAVVEACALAADLKILPAGDQTEIGENGVTYSILLANGSFSLWILLGKPLRRSEAESRSSKSGLPERRHRPTRRPAQRC